MVATCLDFPLGTRGKGRHWCAETDGNLAQFQRRNFNDEGKGLRVCHRRAGEARFSNSTQKPISLAQKMPLRITNRITTRSGAALMKSISRAAVSQAANLMIGSGPSANSGRSLFPHQTGIVLSGIGEILGTEIEIQRAETLGVETMERSNKCRIW